MAATRSHAPHPHTLQGASGNVSLVVGHLKSYEHMGQFSVACLAGCACDPRMVDGNHVHKTSQLYMAEQAVTQHCARVMRGCSRACVAGAACRSAREGRELQAPA